MRFLGYSVLEELLDEAKYSVAVVADEGVEYTFDECLRYAQMRLAHSRAFQQDYRDMIVPDVACVYDRQAAYLCKTGELDVLPLFVTTDGIRPGQRTTPRAVARILAQWRRDLGEALIPVPLIGSHDDYLAVRLDVPVCHLDRAFLVLQTDLLDEDADRAACWERYFEEKYACVRRERLLFAALCALRRTVTEKRARLALGPAIMRWALAPGGPIVRIAKRSFAEMKGELG